MAWYKGNIHTHTNASDGDSSFRKVGDWYRKKGYDFLFITDHNKSTKFKLYRQKKDFLLIRGNEFSSYVKGKAAHLCALGYEEDGCPNVKETITETLQAQIDEARDKGAVPIVNHPNWKWSFSYEEMMQLTNVKLFEIYNMSSEANNHGGGSSLSTEDLWDRMLTSGKTIYGVASDDAHHLKRRFDKSEDFPGKGWVVVDADNLDSKLITEALDKGRFYSSTGVSLETITWGNSTLKLEIAQDCDFKYTTEFIGQDGKILAKRLSLMPEYRLDGTERYVRARVRSSDGGYAWTQPLFFDARLDQ